MTKEFLKHCKFYKGENDAPQDKDYDTFQRFWYLEYGYFGTVVYENEHEYWEDEGIERWCREPKEFYEFIMSHDKTTRGFLAYSAITALSQCPAGGIYWITNYDK